MAVNRAAQQAGLRAGISVADAMAMVPGLRLVPADEKAERRLLKNLAERCGVFSPWTAPEDSFQMPLADIPGGGLWLDISGCDHLFGGEAELLGKLCDCLRGFGFACRAAIADTPGAAWAWARYGSQENPVLEREMQHKGLAALPIAALRLSPTIVGALSALGLRKIGDLLALPRASLSIRFGREVAHRLDQALGIEPEPISPLRPAAAHRVHMGFAEPIGRDADVKEAARRLLHHLCGKLEDERLGVRRLALLAFLVDGNLREFELGTSAPNHDPAHLFRLLREKLDGIDCGFGIESLRLDARETASLLPRQKDMEGNGSGSEEMTRLIDTLSNRLGFDKVMRLVPHDSHIPERAQQAMPASKTIASPRQIDPPAQKRPVLLLDHPENVEVTALLPDSPPLQFRWRKRVHRVARAEGPERISCEWWQEQKPDRDYYRIEDGEGNRYWLFRAGPYDQKGAAQWFLHGIFP